MSHDRPAPCSRLLAPPPGRGREGRWKEAAVAEKRRGRSQGGGVGGSSDGGPCSPGVERACMRVCVCGPLIRRCPPAPLPSVAAVSAPPSVLPPGRPGAQCPRDPARGQSASGSQVSNHNAGQSPPPAARGQSAGGTTTVSSRKWLAGRPIAARLAGRPITAEAGRSNHSAAGAAANHSGGWQIQSQSGWSGGQSQHGWQIQLQCPPRPPTQSVGGPPPRPPINVGVPVTTPGAVGRGSFWEM